jgi:hypothetical protein
MAKFIVQHRRGSAAQWASKDTMIPKEGELVIEFDEVNSLHKLKIGDGIHAYSELAYLQAGDEIITQVLAEAKPRVVTVTLEETWNQDAEGKYSQVISLDDITEHSRLDLQPDVNMLAEFKQLGLVFVTENNGGIITVYSVGNMPSKSYTMQATIVNTECDGQEVVIGLPIGASATQSDFNQTDETKSDYIKNKPDINGIVDTKVASVVDSAPEALNTLNKLATSLGNDPDFATTVTNQLDTKVDKEEGSRLITSDEVAKLGALILNDDNYVEISGKVNAESVIGLSDMLATKVDKVEGKGLSTEDYTTEEKTKLANIYVQSTTPTDAIVGAIWVDIGEVDA